MQTHKSEVAQLLQKIDEEREAARQGLYGYAQVATHESITARAERGAERILRLGDEGKHDEAKRLMDTPGWGVEEETSITILQQGDQTSKQEEHSI